MHSRERIECARKLEYTRVPWSPLVPAMRLPATVAEQIHKSIVAEHVYEAVSQPFVMLRKHSDTLGNIARHRPRVSIRVPTRSDKVAELTAWLPHTATRVRVTHFIPPARQLKSDALVYTAVASHVEAIEPYAILLLRVMVDVLVDENHERVGCEPGEARYIVRVSCRVFWPPLRVQSVCVARVALNDNALQRSSWLDQHVCRRQKRETRTAIRWPVCQL